MVRIFLGWAALGLALSLVACGNITGLNGFTSSSGGGADASVRPDGSVGRDGSLGTTMPEASADAGPGEEASADGSDDSGEDSGDGAVEEGGCGSGALECDGGCVTPSIDPLNCGSCGNACPTAVTGSTPTCVQSVCSYECNPGLNVCGSSCVSLTTAANCGSCGAACTGTDVCASDGVYYGCATSCPPTEPTACSGACSDLTSDPLNCGSCGNVCTTAVANATPTCSGSSCSFTCDAGYNLCNGACIAYDTAQNCGACGVQCAPDGGAPACALSSGVYACVSGCPGSQVLCNGGCVDTTSNPSDCASCGHVCTTSVANATATCATSACSFSCNSGYSQCGGQCVNETTDRNNCGSCGAVCPETMPYCVGSSCVSNCPAATPTLCSGSCVNTATNIANCGTCGNGCSTSVANATAGCVSSACTFTCNTGFALCNGACVNEQTSTTNCGGCGSSYACGSGQVCLGGACQNVCSASSQCPAGFACNTSTGQCTTTCSASQTCNGGCCSSGTCVNGESATACGGNGAACSSCTTSVANASAACPSNACSFVCNTNYTDCSGVCVAEQTDPNNCNGCGVVCPGVANGTATCASGACGFKCNSGYSACDGACINEQTDDNACGSCTNACVSPMTCKAGVCSHGCVVGGCDAAGGACTAAGQRCYCTANSECASGQCAEVTGDNDMSCSGCTTTSAATDGFACVLKANGIPATPLPSFGYTPANFTPASYMGDLPSSATTISASCSYTSDKQSSAGTANGTYWTCGGTAPYVIPNVSQSGSGPKVDILVFSSLTLASGATLTLTGSNPVIFAVYGSVTISGTINASASGTTPGAGGDNGTYCGTGAAGANGNNGASGGGGGGKAVAGGTGECGGQACAGHLTTAGGAANDTGLGGGCAGGVGEASFPDSTPTNPAGAGGGAVQISASGAITGAGSITANGAGGTNGGTGQFGIGAGGGGSGGYILLQGSQTTAPSITLSANGGAGGSATAGGGAGGTNNGTTQVAPGNAASLGTGGDFINEEGGGGGGAYGYVTINNGETTGTGFTCVTTLSPQPVSSSGGTACLCVANSNCPSGLCSNVSGQCGSNTCTGTTTAGTYDSADCQLLTSY